MQLLAAVLVKAEEARMGTYVWTLILSVFGGSLVFESVIRRLKSHYEEEESNTLRRRIMWLESIVEKKQGLAERLWSRYVNFCTLKEAGPSVPVVEKKEEST